MIINNIAKTLGLAVTAALMTACGHETPSNVRNVDSLPRIYPDYIGVTIPSGIAPLNFCIDNAAVSDIYVKVTGHKGGEMESGGQCTDFDIDEWHELSQKNIGDSIMVTVIAKENGEWLKYNDFSIYVSEDAMDEYGLTYRRIAPGYETYNHLGIYQRELSTFREESVMDNNEVHGACFNCHTGNRCSNKDYLFHVRGENGATVVCKDGKQQLLNTKTDKTIGSLVYPYWHKDGRYVAFSSNVTRQSFHAVKDMRIEVFDNASDIIVYDTEKQEILYTPLTNNTEQTLETFPVFSADGKEIFYCASPKIESTKPVDSLWYSMYKIGFDVEKRKFGSKIDTVLDLTDRKLAINHPRPSYDGRYLMFTTCSYGTFPIWHKEADMWMMDLKSGEYWPMDNANSDDTDSYHNWNLNSHWVVFTSRRDDGLYTRLYLVHIDENGKDSKPFLLPQRNPKQYYDAMMYSYNTPDFLAERIVTDQKAMANKITAPERTNITASSAE